MVLEGNNFYTSPSTSARDIDIYRLSVLKNTIICCVVCMQVEVTTDWIKSLSKKILYFEVHHEVAEEAASAPSCRQHIIEPPSQNSTSEPG